MYIYDWSHDVMTHSCLITVEFMRYYTSSLTFDLV